MKTKVKRLSKRTLAMFLGVLMLITSIGVGSYITVNSATETTVYYAVPSATVGSYTVRCNVNRKGDGNDWAQYTMEDTGKTMDSNKVYSVTFTDLYNGLGALQFQLYNGNSWISQVQPITSWTSASNYNGKVWVNGGSSWQTLQYDVVKTPLTTPEFTINGEPANAAVTSGVNVPVKITNWSSFASSISSNYCTLALYKGDTKIKDITSETTNVSFTAAGNYYVKCEPTSSTEATYSASQSSDINVKFNVTFYIHNTSDWDFSKMKYYLYGGSQAAGSWEGTSMSGDSKTTLIGTSDSHNVYQVTITTDDTHIILVESGSKQTKGDNTTALENGKVYTTVDTDKAPSTVSNFADLVMDKEKFDVAVTSVTGGSVTASPTSAEEGATVTLTISPSTGYQLSSITAKDSSNATVTLSGTGNTRTFTMPAKNVTVTPAFSKINYTVTLNKNATDATAGTASVTATYGDAMPSATMPTRTGYTFAGYYDTNATSGGNMYYKANGTSNKNWDKTSDTTLYARWTAVTALVKAAAYTSGSASTTGGTVSPTSLSSVTIASTNKSITATKNNNYSLSGWQISGDNAAHLKYRFGTSGTWTAATKDAVINNTGTTIYIQTDGSSGITTSNAEVRALFVETDYTGLTVGAQYTENNSTYTDFETTPSGVTIAANHGTNQTGVAVTAPGTDPTGYVFAGWYTANGSFTNAANKDTTFKPNAANAVAIAKYKKIFTITSSVDNTGTGAGTVTTNKTEVEAGGSYTITATAESGSAIESIKVNGTAKTATASQTISSVSADQTVVVKFKSKAHLIGGLATNGWNEPGDALKSNSDGSKFTITISEKAAGTYEFKHYVGTGTGGTYDATAIPAASQTLNGIATLDNTGTNGNYKLVTTVKSNIILESNGTKFTSITVTPANVPTYNVTLKKVAGSTITSTYMGKDYSTASADAVVPVYQGTEISFTVTADSGKYLSGLTTSAGTLSPAFAVGTTYTGKISNVTSARTVTPTVANAFTVKSATNKSARGTVSVDPTTAYPGQTVTITVSPKNGVLKTLTYTYGSTTETLYPTNSNSAQAQRSTDGMAVFAYRDKVSKLKTSATAKLFSGADSTYTFTMPSEAVTVNATFDAYSGESTWYYNGYDTSGNAVSGYHGKQMTEGMVSGEKFSYYHVEGRTGTDQLMTVSDGVPSSGTRYVYFVRPNNYGDGWSASNNPKAHFWKNGGQDYDTWPGTEMSWQWNNDYGQGVYKIAIPDGADRVSFNDATNNGQHQTIDIDLTTTSGAYYVGEWNSTYSKYNYGTWDTGWADQGWVASGTEYFYQNSTHNGDYTGDFNTKGFYNHYTASKEFAKPKELGTNTGDYYINVLYPNTTYTINGVTKTTGSNPMIIWSAEPLAGDDETTTIYAKDGSIRSEAYGSTYANIADTKIYLNNETVGTKHSGNITNQTYETYKAAKGDTIVIKTQIGATDSSTLTNAADLKAKYYVRGFCVNGEVTELLEWNADGLYTLTYKVPEDEELSKIEITPIYYLKDTTANPIVTYRVTGFTDELKAVGSGKPNWGNTLYTYPFYGKLGSNNNALGAYPGQPMVYYKGQYQMQIPQKSTAWDIYYADAALSGTNEAKATQVANTNVSGVTMSNGYYDLVHRTVMGYGSNGASADHVQTYDYGDFYKIFNEKAPVDNIVFDFKYETTTHNFETTAPSSPTPSNLTSTYKNGFELLTNFHGRTVDLFGDPLSGDAANPSTTKPLYVVSIGGVNGSAGVENIAGYYATEWKVFAPNTTTGTPAANDAYKLVSISNGKSSIPPEVLVLNNNSTSFNNTTYPSADANHTLTDWKALYTALEAYRGKPVMISYEAADAQIGSGNYATSGSGGATRNDGRWLYSKNGENITGKIKIQYSDDNGDNYTDLSTTTPEVSGLSAYFTNDGVEGEMTYATTIDPDKTFDFEAKTTNADYKFVGWYMEDGTKITTDNASHTERSGSYTFVAKFMQVQGGQLILSHSADKGTISGTDYQGAGTAKISAVVKDGDEVVRTYDLTTSDITLDDKIIKSDSTYTIEVTLEATATGNDTLGTTVLANPSGEDSTYFSAASTSTEGKTKTIVLNSFTVASLFSGTTQNVKNIIYHSYFTAATFHYDLLFEYTDRTGATKQYYRQGYLTSAQAANTEYVSVGEYDAESGRTPRRLMPAFIQKIAPHVSNFGEKITWGIRSTGYEFNVQNHQYTLVETVLANQTKNDKRNVTFKLPYEHTNGVATLTDGVGTAATTLDFELTGNNAVDFETIPTLLNNDTNGILTEDGKKNWIAAPAVINDNGTQKFFQYWSIASTADEDNEVARCYFNGFNYAILENYTITAKYGAVKTNIVDSGIFTGATYLETSRNQWNTKASSGKNDKDASGTRIAADLLYNDFVLNYNFKGVDIYKGGTDTDAIQELGIVVERIQELDTKQDGTKDTTISKYTGLAQNIDTVKAVINGTSSDKKFTKHAINKTDLDNKNRYRVYDAFYNGAGWDLEKQASATNYAYRNYVYRIYSYIKYTDDQGDTQIALAELPSYFTMYDEATLTYQTRVESEEG